jgi:hypothetical protein
VREPVLNRPNELNAMQPAITNGWRGTELRLRGLDEEHADAVLRPKQATSSGIGAGQQLSLPAFRTKRMDPFSRDAQDHRHTRFYPRRPPRRHAVAVGDLRTVPTSHTYGIRDFRSSGGALRPQATRCAARPDARGAAARGATIQIPGWVDYRRQCADGRRSPPKLGYPLPPGSIPSTSDPRTREFPGRGEPRPCPVRTPT